MFPPPKTLSDLLADVAECFRDEESYNQVDEVIETHHWAKQFVVYLRKRNLEEDIDLFRFLILMQCLMRVQESLSNNNNSSKSSKAREKLVGERTLLFGMIVKRYFGEESDAQIPLSNQKLFGILSSYAANEATECNEGTISHLAKARDDASVWSDGLEPTYTKFLKTTPTSTSAIACLLSIL